MQSEATALLLRLKKAYRGYLRGGPWERCQCDVQYQRVVAFVADSAQRERLDGCIVKAANGGALNPRRAVDRLRHQNSAFRAVEQRFAEELGFPRRSHEKWTTLAIREASRLDDEQKTLPGCASTAAALALLEGTHALVRSSASRSGDLAPYRARRQTRKLALREVDRRVYVVGMLLANGEVRNVFNLSYALSSGVAAFPPKCGRKVPPALRDGWRDWPAEWRTLDAEPPSDGSKGVAA